ncbi:hypothetical protein TRVA0_010S00210 [Trichomonascus vanleenenianus]|uniref:uncharacterized protein n=1 Tax=Trichomonascus vanleenenianus TaxID=2268995 RepID=UPI003EC9D61A
MCGGVPRVNMSAFTSLPGEILQMVISHLDVASVLGLLETSHLLGNCIPASYWHHLHVNLFSEEDLVGSSVWDAHCHSSHRRAIRRILVNDRYTSEIKGSVLPLLCNSVVAASVLSKVRVLTLSISSGEPLVLREVPGEGIALISNAPYLELLLRVLVPRHCRALTDIQLRAVLSDNARIPPYHKLLLRFPSARKHVWFYAFGIGGLVELELASVANVHHFGLCFTGSTQDAAYRLIYPRIGPYIPHSTRTLYLCGDKLPVNSYPEIIPNCVHLHTLVLLTFSSEPIIFDSLPPSVQIFAWDSHFGPGGHLLRLPHISSCELFAYRRINFAFENLATLSICFLPGPTISGTQAAVREIVDSLAMALVNNPSLTQFRCSGLSLQSLLYLIQTCAAFRHLERIVMAQTHQFFTEKLSLSPSTISELFRSLSELTALTLENLFPDDLSVLVDFNALQTIIDLCPLLHDFLFTSPEPDIAHPLVVRTLRHLDDDSWIRLHDESVFYSNVYRVACR